MKTKYKTVIIIAVIVVIILLMVVFFIGIPRIRGHLYTGDRITVNLFVNFDGTAISLKDLNATCTYENKVDTIVNSLDGIYKTRGGEYGKYSFELIIPKDRLIGFDNDLLIKLDYLNTNNWYISESNCIIDLYTGENRIYGSSNVIVKYNDGTSDEYNKDIDMNNSVINVNWGL